MMIDGVNLGEWHFVHVLDDDEDDGERAVEVVHRDRCTTVVTFRPTGVEMEHQCGLSHEFEMIGDLDALGNPEPGWYAARHWTERSASGSWGFFEFTAGIEVIPLAEWAAKGVIDGGGS